MVFHVPQKNDTNPLEDIDLGVLFGLFIWGCLKTGSFEGRFGPPEVLLEARERASARRSDGKAALRALSPRRPFGPTAAGFPRPRKEEAFCPSTGL